METLPTELMREILQYLSKANLKNVRLVSKLWSGCASENLFTKLFISPHKLNLLTFAAVGRDPLLSRYVKEIEYDAVYFTHITITKYFEKLWVQTAFYLEDLPESVDPQIHQFFTLARLRTGANWIRSRAEAETHCLQSGFFQEGYRKWMDQADFQENCSRENMVLRCLITGFKIFGRLRTVRLRGGWPSTSKRRRRGSPLARSWHPFHAHPGDWEIGPDQPPKECSPSHDFWTLAYALSEAKNDRIRNLSIESSLPPSVFSITTRMTECRVDFGVAAYCRLEYLKLSLADYHSLPASALYDNLHGLNRMLESMVALKQFELDLPDDCNNDIEDFFPYKMIFPRNGYWPQLTIFTVQNLAISTKDLITLLLTNMPKLTQLSFGSIKLLDGQWEGILEYLRIANRFSSFQKESQSLLLHGGDTYYLSRDHDDHSRRGIHYAFVRSLEDYVVKWWHNPTLRHPSLKKNQPAQQSLDYLPNVFRLCEWDDMGDILEELTQHMLSEAARYHEWEEAWARQNWLEDLPVSLHD
ncbi:hypothetical protein IMSHALPRED_006479 [Imshaugia aleurites]|uniref:F-box domain-containing protein n=1 Tax=Imshaugia aleurites TaxID=172621 RepID=A0A8H3FMC7_9LECA|nr:hypothetical protein IMSHALPRED_006479 [Imshaugia aleurites]